MSNPLFSTYKQGENRVTATILAVFERLSFAIVEKILQSVFEEPEASLVNFQNQPPGPESIPDARINASFDYWIETKTSQGAISLNQLRHHLEALNEQRFIKQRMLVLTPDPVKPVILQEIDDERLVWTNFENLTQAIQNAIQIEENWLSSDSPLPSESERELLRELIQFLATEKLIGDSQDRILIVAARIAYPEYLRYGFYFCQANRSFRHCSHIGFYHNGEIAPIFPKIRKVIENIQINESVVNKHNGLSDPEKEFLSSAIKKLREDQNPRVDVQEKVMFLSDPDTTETIKLASPILNDLVTDNGRGTAFTQGHRYVTLEAIKKSPTTTSELLLISNQK